MKMTKKLQAVQKILPTLVVSGIVMTLCVILGTLFFVRGKNVLEDQLKQRMTNIAGSAALAFRDIDLRKIQGPKDINRSEYADAITVLNLVRAANVGVKYAYIFRPTDDPNIFVFVADADSLHPYDKIDGNGDGVIDGADELSPPGTPYDTSKIDDLHEAMTKPVGTNYPYSDQWGTFMSGFAPIIDQHGRFMGILGVDMDVQYYNTISQSIFSPLAYLLFLLSGIAISWLIVLTVWKRRMESLAMLELQRIELLQLTFHQLGSPLTIIRWATESLEGKLGEMAVPLSISKDIASLKDGSGRIDSILKSLSRAEDVRSGTMRYNPTVASLRSVIEEVSHDMQDVLRMKAQKLNIASIPEVELHIDRTLIAAVMREIIGNASDFSPNSSAIHLECTIDGKKAIVEVRDHGGGIPQKDIQNLFQEFKRASNAKLLKPSGSGLGLYIAKGIIEKAGGTITLKSKEGKGTSVTFTLPLL